MLIFLISQRSFYAALFSEEKTRGINSDFRAFQKEKLI